MLFFCFDLTNNGLHSNISDFGLKPYLLNACLTPALRLGLLIFRNLWTLAQNHLSSSGLNAKTNIHNKTISLLHNRL
jgi:hypothetical protein